MCVYAVWSSPSFQDQFSFLKLKLQVDTIKQLMCVTRATNDAPFSLHPAALQNSLTGTKYDVPFYCGFVSSN